MDDLISRSALIEEYEWLKSQVNASSVPEIEEHIKRINNAPAVDAVPVVRCAQCKRRYDAAECPMCFLIDGEYHEYTNGNGHCDRGERRSGDAEIH